MQDMCYADLLQECAKLEIKNVKKKVIERSMGKFKYKISKMERK